MREKWSKVMSKLLYITRADGGLVLRARGRVRAADAPACPHVVPAVARPALVVLPALHQRQRAASDAVAVVVHALLGVGVAAADADLPLVVRTRGGARPACWRHRRVAAVEAGVADTALVTHRPVRQRSERAANAVAAPIHTRLGVFSFRADRTRDAGPGEVLPWLAVRDVAAARHQVAPLARPRRVLAPERITVFKNRGESSKRGGVWSGAGVRVL